MMRKLLTAALLALAFLASPARATTTIDPSNAGIYFSPACWNVVSGQASAVTNGCYFKTSLLGATAITLTLNVSNQFQYNYGTKWIAYRIDGGVDGGIEGWTPVQIYNTTTTITLTMPTVTAGGNWTQHMLEVVIRSSDISGNRWDPTPPGPGGNGWSAVNLTGIVCDTGCTAALPYLAGLKLLFLGDSFTEGAYTACDPSSCPSSGLDPNYEQEDIFLTWAWEMLHDLGAEGSVVGFDGQAWDGGSSNNAPAFTTSYNLLYSGVSRSFAGLDGVIINMGQNGAPSGTDVPTVLNGMVTAGLTGQVFVLCPFTPATCTAEKAALSAGVAAAGNPSRFHFIDTSTIVQPANCYVTDGHPIGWCDKFYLGPQTANLIRSYLYPPPSPVFRSGFQP